MSPADTPPDTAAAPCRICDGRGTTHRLGCPNGAATALSIKRRPLPEIVARAADILEATMHNIDTDKGGVSPSSWGSLLAVLGILRGDHEL